MRIKIQPKNITGTTVYTTLPSEVEAEYSDLLCNANFPEYAGYLTPIIIWLQAEHGFGEFDRWYDSNVAPGETFLEFRERRVATLY